MSFIYFYIIVVRDKSNFICYAEIGSVDSVFLQHCNCYAVKPLDLHSPFLFQPFVPSPLPSSLRLRSGTASPFPRFIVTSFHRFSVSPLHLFRWYKDLNSRSRRNIDFKFEDSVALPGTFPHSEEPHRVSGFDNFRVNANAIVSDSH